MTIKNNIGINKIITNLLGEIELYKLYHIIRDKYDRNTIDIEQIVITINERNTDIKYYDHFGSYIKHSNVKEEI